MSIVWKKLLRPVQVFSISSVCEPIFLNTHWIDQWCLVASSAELCFRNSLENDTNLVAVDPAVSFVVMVIRKP